MKDSDIDLPTIIHELGITAVEARRILRREGIEKPHADGWYWSRLKADEIKDVLRSAAKPTHRPYKNLRPQKIF